MIYKVCDLVYTASGYFHIFRKIISIYHLFQLLLHHFVFLLAIQLSLHCNTVPLRCGVTNYRVV